MTDSVNALKDSYYIVGSIALLLSVISFLGLRDLQGEDDKGWASFFHSSSEQKGVSHRNANLLSAIMLGFQVPSLGLAYLGGFVARASSIGITMFVPLLVNTHYISLGLCDQSGQDPVEMKENCRSAYRLAAILTGVSQLVGLLFAPIFGYLADRYRRFNIVLLSAAIMGIIGYLALATLKSPETDGENGSPWIFVVMALVGVSQIGAIVCSLGLIGRCVLGMQGEDHDKSVTCSNDHTVAPREASRVNHAVANVEHQESAPLLERTSTPQDLQHLKGSIAGVYSLSGGLGILLLTKLGGVLFDKNSAAPFVILSVFNALLLIAGVFCGLSILWQRKAAVHSSQGRSGEVEQDFQ